MDLMLIGYAICLTYGRGCRLLRSMVSREDPAANTGSRCGPQLGLVDRTATCLRVR